MAKFPFCFLVSYASVVVFYIHLLIHLFLYFHIWSIHDSRIKCNTSVKLADQQYQHNLESDNLDTAIIMTHNGNYVPSAESIFRIACDEI